MSDPLTLDSDECAEMVFALGAHPDTVQQLTVYGQPHPKERPRLGRGGRTYTPAATEAAEQALALHLNRLRAYPANVCVACIFHRADRRLTDADNLLKLVLDAATKAKLWRDDSQVTGLACRMELDRRKPRTVIALAAHHSTLRRDLRPVPTPQEAPAP